MTKHPRRTRSTPFLETLERRTAPAVVSSLLDDGTAGTLRSVVGLATDGDTITFSVSGTITLNGTNILIDKNLTIDGPGAASALVINGNSLSRIFDVAGALGGVNVLLQDLTLTGGNALTQDGGAIRGYDDTITLSNSVISGNTATEGGGISISYYGKLIVQSSVIKNNSAVADGGGINFDDVGDLVLQESAVTNNKAGDDGGGIYFYFDGALEVRNSTIGSNTAGDDGGGLYFYGDAAPFNVVQSTISNNVASTGRGGGAFLYSFNFAATFNNCTLSGNSSGQAGGGIYIDYGTLNLESTIVSGNTAPAGPEMYGYYYYYPTLNSTNSLITSTAGFEGTINDLGGTIIGQPAGLGPLQDNGGFKLADGTNIQTQALLPGSVAIDKGSNPGALTTDQRGAGFNRAVAPAPDIGAFEVQGSIVTPAKITTVQVNDGSAQRSRVTQVVITFDTVVTLPAVPGDAFQLVRSDTAPVSLSAAVVNGATTVVTLTFTGGAVNGTSLADGRYTLTAFAAQINGGNFDGDPIAPGNNDFVLASTGSPPTNIFRLFGDSNGDGTVNGADFLAFRLAFLSNNATFDFDGSGLVDGTDFLAFRLRFLQSV